MVAAGHATADQMDLIELGFSLFVDAALGQTCVPCGKGMLARVESGLGVGIVEAGMRVSAAAGNALGMTTAIAIHESYDLDNGEDRENAFCDLAEYWADVVVKMRTCGPECPKCIAAGPNWRLSIGFHGTP